VEHAAPAHDRAESLHVETFLGQNVHDGLAPEFILGGDGGEVLELFGGVAQRLVEKPAFTFEHGDLG